MGGMRLALLSPGLVGDVGEATLFAKYEARFEAPDWGERGLDGP